MPNIAAILKQEISRVSRREIRSLTKSLHRASAQFRRDIAELKRQNSKVRSEISRLARLNGGPTAAMADEADSGNFRFSARSVKAQRKRLGISAAQYGKLIGVTAASVYNWEHGASKPRRGQLASLAAIRGLGKREIKQRLEGENKRRKKA